MGGGNDADDGTTRRLDATTGDAQAPAAVVALAPGMRFGDYLLVARLGRGGMGEVWRARQLALDREVALKFVAVAADGSGSDGGRRFRDEARHAARIQHPNIVEIHDFGRIDGQDFYSMRLVEGRSLARRIRDDGPLPPREAARLLRTIAEAIDYAHRLGVLHLDLKPANILLGADGEPMVSDFGLARRVDAGHSGEIAGTPGYMAPEQQAHGALDARTDVFGLGAVFYHLLAGRRLPGGDLSTAWPLSTKRRPVPADLEAICRRCLAEAREDRYASARELADDLQRFLEGRTVSARPLAPPARVVRWARREPVLALALATVFAVLSGGLAATLWQWRQAEDARLAAEDQRRLAEQRAERNDQLVALMAQVYPEGEEGEAGREPGEIIVDWLHRELPDRDEDQADILTAFITALDAADKPGAAQALLFPVTTHLGAEYRRRSADVLAARGDPRSQALAVMLLAEDSPSPEVSARQLELIRAAMISAPEDLDVLVIATYYCAMPGCDAIDPAGALARLEPDNAMNWALAAAAHADDPAAVREHLRRAARSPRLDDHSTRILGLNTLAGVSSGLPMPAALLRPASLLSGEQAPEHLVAFVQSYHTPFPSFTAFIGICDPRRAGAPDPELRADCLGFARKAMGEGKGLLTRLIGSVLIRRLVPGTPEADAALEVRREYLYVFAMLGNLTAEQERRSRPDLQPAEWVEHGELESAKRMLDRAGIPRDPPPGWEPDDPQQLLLPEQRTPR